MPPIMLENSLESFWHWRSSAPCTAVLTGVSLRNAADGTIRYIIASAYSPAVISVNITHIVVVSSTPS